MWKPDEAAHYQDGNRTGRLWLSCMGDAGGYSALVSVGMCC